MGKSKIDWQQEYEEKFGEAPDDGMTVKEMKVAIKPQKTVVGLYWKNPIHIHELGLQRGHVTTEASKAFRKMADESGSGAKIEDWTTDRDMEGEREAEARRKMRAQLGLPAE